MNFRSSVLFSVAFVTVAGAAHAQSREDLLDQLVRHIQLCAEITDTQQRLACYDKMQNNVGGGAPSSQAGNRAPPSPAPTPTPTPIPSTPPASSGGGSYSATPLQPPPLSTPGGGVATIGGSSGESSQTNPPPPSYDPDRAYDPNASSSTGAAAAGPKPQPPVRRTGPRPLPRFNQPMPLVTLTASNLTYGASRYWQVSISITSNTPDTVNAQIQCTFRNAGRSVGDAYFGPVGLAPGEQITTDLIGPPTSTYVDSTNCRVVSP